MLVVVCVLVSNLAPLVAHGYYGSHFLGPNVVSPVPLLFLYQLFHYRLKL